MENPEPDVPSEEIVDVGTRCHKRAITIRYTPRGVFQVDDGDLVKKSVRMTVRSNKDKTYTITRHQGGVYKANSWFTWVKRRR